MARLQWSWIAAVVVWGCGGSDGLSLEDYSSHLLAAHCENQVACGASESVESCAAGIVARQQLEQSVAAGRIVYDPAQAQSCVDALAVLTCDTNDKAWLSGPAACRGVFEGTVADGGECFTGLECLSQACSVPDCGLACCVGTCAPTEVPGAVGQPCGNGRCVDDAYCSGGTCRAFIPAGGACTASYYCASGLGCVGAVCADFPERGEPCPQQVCSGSGDRCDTQTCVPRLGFGGVCSVARDCQDPLYCASDRHCRAPATAGQTCSLTIPCAAGAYCAAGNTCATVLEDGQACTRDAQCRSDYCDPFAGNQACAVRPVCG